MVKVLLEPWAIPAWAMVVIPLPVFLLCARIAHFYPRLSPLTAEFISEQLSQLLLHSCYWSRALDLLHPWEHPGAARLPVLHPKFCPAAEPCCTLERQQVPNGVTPVAQMSLHCDQGPSQGFSGGTPPCHLVGLCSCTPQPQVSKQFISSNQVCLVIPHWEGCESTENNHLHLLSGAATCPRPEAVPGAPCPSEHSAWHKESLISTWGRAHLCRVTAGQI